MKITLGKILGASLALMMAANVNAALIFQGSSSLSADVTMTTAEARAAWEAELRSFTNDTIDGVTGSGPYTTSVGNIYSETGNGSTITAGGGRIGGNRSGASLIEFNVAFPMPVNAVGFDVTDNDGGDMTLFLTDARTGAESEFNFTSVNRSGITEFFGVVFAPTTFISNLRVAGTDPGGITSWDNFTTGVGQQAIVEASAPGTIAFFGLFLSALALRARRS